MKTKATFAVFSLVLSAAFTLPAGAQDKPGGSAPLDRTVLPIQGPTPKAIATLSARDAKAPPRFEVTAPKGAPNVVIVIIERILRHVGSGA